MEHIGRHQSEILVLSSPEGLHNSRELSPMETIHINCEVLCKRKFKTTIAYILTANQPFAPIELIDKINTK